MYQTFWMLKLCLIIILLPLRIGKAQIGSDCSETRTCYDHQTCYFGYCSCERGYVRNDKHCFRVKSYGETCFFDVQCNDHRMVCNTTDANSNVKRCICDSMHVWNEEKKGCTMTMNVTEMLANLKIRDLAEKLAKEDERVFVGVVIAGIAVIILGATFTFFCVFYGCCLYECFESWVSLEAGEGAKRAKCDASCPQYVPPTTPVSLWRR